MINKEFLISLLVDPWRARQEPEPSLILFHADIGKEEPVVEPEEKMEWRVK